MSWLLPANKHQSGRERFAPPRSVAGAFLSFILLLAILFPESSILRILGNKPVLSPVIIAYMQGLIRVRPGDAELRLSYAGALLAVNRNMEANRALEDAWSAIPPKFMHNALEMRLSALGRLLEKLDAENPRRPVLEKTFISVARELVNTGPKPEERQRYAYISHAARANGAIALFEPPASAGGGGEPTAESALASGDYRTSARLCFSAMTQEQNIARRREFFLKGVRTLQSGNLMDEAMAAAERHIDGLSADRETLMFLTKLALAANRPSKAQEYIKKALRMDPEHNGGNGT